MRKQLLQPMLATVLFLALLCSIDVSAQTTIFSENMGTPSGTVSIASNTFQNSGTLTYGGTADVRITSPSSGYTGASGGGNVFFTNTTAGRNFEISGINTSGYTGLALTFGMFRSAAGSMAVEVSSDGVNYTPLTYTISVNSTWVLISPTGTIPATSNLRIRFTNTTTTAQWRVDDVKLTGTLPAAAVPGAPVVSNPQISSLDVTIDANAQNGNGAAIQYAIQETTTGNYVQADGTLAGTAVWQTAATWGTVNVHGLLSSTEYIFRLKARNAASVETAFGPTASGTTLDNEAPFVTLDAPLGAFGSVCTNATATGSFTFDGANLDGSDIVVNSLDGYSYSLTENGTYASTLNIPYVGGSIEDQVVWVQFAPGAVQSYDGNIQLTGGGMAAPYNVAVTGSGINTAVSVTTGSASAITSVQATAAGSLTEGCTSVTAYGIEYSITNGFANGAGTQVTASNLAGGAFSATLTGLSANAQYYFKAFATDATGTVYGSQQTFTTANLSAPNATAATSVTNGSFIANWDAIPGATSYVIDVKTDPFLPDPVTTPWINEIHYEDAGTDGNEFIELVVPDNYTGSGVTLTLYNGSNGTEYSTILLSEMTLVANTSVYNIYQITLPVDGIQNGAPDGIALSDSDGLIQFLSYEGTFTATNGPADEVTSTDVGVTESTATLDGSSIYLTGTGTQYSDFTWTSSSGTNTKGNINTGQTINAAAAAGVYIAQDLNVGNVTSFEVTGLAANTDYYYRVRAVSTNSVSPNSNVISVTTLQAEPTFGSISAAAGFVCQDSEATFNVTGLVPNITSTLTFNIGGGSPINVDVTADESGAGSFTYMLALGNDGQVLTVTSVVREDAPGNPVAVTTNNTVVLNVNANVTYYADADNDGYGDFNVEAVSCSGAPEGYVADSTDCNDDNNAVHPGAVEIGYNLIDDDCDGSIDEGFPPKATVVQGALCNTTLSAIDTQIVANLVAGAQGYRWRVTTLTGPTAGQEQTLDTALRVMKLTQLVNYAFDTQYKIEIAVYYAGFLQQFNASSCNVTTPIATTQLSVCGQNLTNLQNVIYANIVPFASGYRFRITDPVNPTNTQVLERSIREFRMSLITNFTVQYNKTYNVEVSVKNTDGTWLPYGATCNVTTPAFPTTSLQDSQCEDYLVPSNNTQIYASSYPGAVAYVFQLTGPGIVAPLEVTKTVRTFTLNDFPGLIPGATYNVKVRLVFDFADPVGPYGKTCTIVTPGVTRPGVVKAGFDVVASPNPFADNFNIALTSAATDDVNVKVYDMTGRLIDSITFKASAASSLVAGENYPSGVYNVIVTQGSDSKALRLVKR